MRPRTREKATRVTIRANPIRSLCSLSSSGSCPMSTCNNDDDEHDDDNDDDDDDDNEKNDNDD